MVTLKQIYKELKEIRYYYSKQKQFDDKHNPVQSGVLSLVEKYHNAIKNAPARLYDLYISLYFYNRTQATVAYDWDFTDDYIKQLNKQLCEYFQQAFNGE